MIPVVARTPRPQAPAWPPGLEGPPASRWPPWAVAVVVAWLGLGALVAFVTRAFAIPGPPCLFRLATTVPCPTCGSGRGAERLVSGDVLGALAMNPLVFAALLGGIAFLGIRRLGRWRASPRLPTGARPVLFLSAALLVAGNWLYLVLAGR